jgi:hypothetical protein
VRAGGWSCRALHGEIDSALRLHHNMFEHSANSECTAVVRPLHDLRDTAAELHADRQRTAYVNSANFTKKNQVCKRHKPVHSDACSSSVVPILTGLWVCVCGPCAADSRLRLHALSA